tara:strand:+ start:5452 stop:5625 length:174 start_codon:yes stop_codon:yes gene_type:complete
MKVLLVYDDLTVPEAGYDDPLVLELVAHFLGIATHHNKNAPPSASPRLEVISDTQDP